MALTAMPGCTATDVFAGAPVGVRTAPAGGVTMHAACAFIPGWTCTTAFGGPGTVGGRLTATPLADLELAYDPHGDLRIVRDAHVHDAGADPEYRRPRSPGPHQNLGVVRVQDAGRVSVPPPGNPIPALRDVCRGCGERERDRIGGRVVGRACLGGVHRDQVVQGGQVRHPGKVRRAEGEDHGGGHGVSCCVPAFAMPINIRCAAVIIAAPIMSAPARCNPTYSDTIAA